MPGEHSAKEKRQASHIVDSAKDRGYSDEDAERMAWATVNKHRKKAKKAAIVVSESRFDKAFSQRISEVACAGDAEVDAFVDEFVKGMFGPATKYPNDSYHQSKLVPAAVHSAARRAFGDGTAQDVAAKRAAKHVETKFSGATHDEHVVHAKLHAGIAAAYRAAGMGVHAAAHDAMSSAHLGAASKKQVEKADVAKSRLYQHSLHLRGGNYHYYEHGGGIQSVVFSPHSKPEHRREDHVHVASAYNESELDEAVKRDAAKRGISIPKPVAKAVEAVMVAKGWGNAANRELVQTSKEHKGLRRAADASVTEGHDAPSLGDASSLHPDVKHEAAKVVEKKGKDSLFNRRDHLEHATKWADMHAYVKHKGGSASERVVSAAMHHAHLEAAAGASAQRSSGEENEKEIEKAGVGSRGGELSHYDAQGKPRYVSQDKKKKPGRVHVYVPHEGRASAPVAEHAGRRVERNDHEARHAEKHERRRKIKKLKRKKTHHPAAVRAMEREARLRSERVSVEGKDAAANKRVQAFDRANKKKFSHAHKAQVIVFDMEKAEPGSLKPPLHSSVREAAAKVVDGGGLKAHQNLQYTALLHAPTLHYDQDGNVHGAYSAKEHARLASRHEDHGDHHEAMTKKPISNARQHAIEAHAHHAMATIHRHLARSLREAVGKAVSDSAEIGHHGGVDPESASKETVMPKSVRDLFKSELGDAEKPLITCPHCDEPITRTQVLEKAGRQKPDLKKGEQKAAGKQAVAKSVSDEEDEGGVKETILEKSEEVVEKGDFSRPRVVGGSPFVTWVDSGLDQYTAEMISKGDHGSALKPVPPIDRLFRS